MKPINKDIGSLRGSQLGKQEYRTLQRKKHERFSNMSSSNVFCKVHILAIRHPELIKPENCKVLYLVFFQHSQFLMKTKIKNLECSHFGKQEYIMDIQGVSGYIVMCQKFEIAIQQTEVQNSLEQENVTQLAGKVSTGHERFQQKPINPRQVGPIGTIFDQN